MPNRIIKESICASEDLNKLSPMAEILFYRLIVNADDYGAYYGNASIVKSNCFPLKSDDIKCSQVEAWLDELQNAGLIIRYIAGDERQYVQFVKWEKHQQTRAKNRKFPELDSTCKQMIANDSKCSRISNTNTNTNISLREGEEIKDNKIYTQETTKGEKFKKPTVEEVAAYCAERNNGVDAERFVSHYDSVGWKVGKNPMKDWRAAVRTWERGDGNGKPVSRNAPPGAKQFKVKYDNE